AFAAVPCAYIADGHHRTASAAVAAREVAGAERDRLPAVLFPASELRILPYNRVVSDLGGLSADASLAELRARGRLAPPGPPVPPARGSFAFYLDGRWHVLELG